MKYKVSILDKHNISQSIYSGTLFLKQSNVRQAKFRISISICVIWTSYYWTHEQDIHIAHIEDSGQTALQ